jgi:hypothetical protein
MMTEEELKAIRERVDAATPGPWQYGSYDGNYSIGSKVGDYIAWNVARHKCCRLYIDEEGNEQFDCSGTGPMNRNDAIFVANARADISRLLDYINYIEKALKETNSKL